MTIQVRYNLGEKIFDKNFFSNFSTTKLFASIVNPLNNAPGVYLITEILERIYWKGFLKEEASKKIGNCKKLIKLIKCRNCV